LEIVAEQYTDRVTFHGEGAVWWDAWGGLRCVDMLAGDVLQVGADGAVARHHLGAVAAMLRPCRPGLSLVALEREVVLWNEDDGTLTAITGDLVGVGSRLNEGGCSPGGRLFIGSLSYNLSNGGGELFCISPSGRSSVVLPDVTVSNGIGFSPDGSRAYYVDSASGRVDQFTVLPDSEALVERRPFATIDPDHGAPDGLWVDTAGGVWVAIYGGSAVRRYRADGRLDEVVRVPARQVTSCTFGGEDGSTIFITTSRENLRDDEDPLAGCIFTAETGIRGLPVSLFEPTSASPGNKREQEA
jgi:sugar lactone lactonase YvrE